MYEKIVTLAVISSTTLHYTNSKISAEIQLEIVSFSRSDYIFIFS